MKFPDVGVGVGVVVGCRVVWGAGVDVAYGWRENLRVVVLLAYTLTKRDVEI